MRHCARVLRASAIALLCASAVPSRVWAHVEGVEVSDPSTPAALLMLETAAVRYTALNSEPQPWRRALGDVAGPAAQVEPHVPSANVDPAHAGHGGAARHSPAKTQQ